MIRILDALCDRFDGFTLLGFLIYFLMWLGCAERQELRGQQCAQLALERHGAHRPRGVYGVEVRGDRCFSRLWDGERVAEGRLGRGWRPE